MITKRLKVLKEVNCNKGNVVYWMQRDQRVHDNWALLYAQQKAIETKSHLYVVFNLVPTFLEATIRQYDFMIKGLHQVEEELKRFNIPFIFLSGSVEMEIPKFVKTIDAKLLVTDFNPLKIIKQWKKSVAEKIDVPLHEIDAHNIVPYHQASNKAEFAAYTIRPKINRLLPEFLGEFPELKQMKQNIEQVKINWDSIYKSLKVDKSVKPVDWLKAGEKSANKVLEEFINHKLRNYSIDKNDPTKDAQSNLSAYLHFGQIAPQRVALAVQPIFENLDSQKAFLEELIVRRELSDNFCSYNENYDSLDGFPQWAKDSLNIHRKDKREHIYTLEEFELAKTHDALWNAAQMEMVKKGKVHGYMRMYWAKKILEWTKSPEDAMNIAIYLNDKYELDGRDPNGYAGIAWSIGGVHDRPWAERPVFGKIRYMNYNGCARKFDVKKYIQLNLNH